jgi:hypothetical protein
MAVVINEFEVVPATPAKGESGGGEGEKAPAAGGPTPQDVERMLRRAHERATRLRAH